MKLYIEKESLVDDIKRVFTACYPFLKLEFYKKQISPNNYSQRKEAISSRASLIGLAKVPDKRMIDIDNDRTVAELENEFASLGLVAEVFRRSGNVWVETSLTSDWTLGQQNLEGEEISRHFHKEIN